jgi:hypothetical protein
LLIPVVVPDFALLDVIFLVFILVSVAARAVEFCSLVAPPGYQSAEIVRIIARTG